MRRKVALVLMLVGGVLWALGAELTQAEPVLPLPFFVIGVLLFLAGGFILL